MATMLSIAEVTGTSLTRCIAESRETPLSGSIRRACLLKRGSDYQLRPRLNDLDQLAMLGELPLEPAAGYKVMVEMNRSSLAIIGRTEHHLVFRAVAGHGGRHEDGTLVGNPEGPPPCPRHGASHVFFPAPQKSPALCWPFSMRILTTRAQPGSAFITASPEAA